MGDTFGGQFFWKPELPERIGKRELAPPTWSWSDDTAMGRSVVVCLGAEQQIVPDTLAGLLAEEYQRQPTRGYGTMAHTVLQDINQGVPWQKAAGDVFDGSGSFGNGAAMRAAPVGAYFAEDITKVVKEAHRSAMVTHAHKDGQAGAVAVAVAAAWVTQNRAQDGRAMLDWVLSHTPESDTRSNLKQALDLPLSREPKEAASLLGSGDNITSQDTVPFALWCAARHLDSYSEALWATVSGLGDMDTTCAIVGSIVVLGDPNGIPTEWIKNSEPLNEEVSTLHEIAKVQTRQEKTDQAISIYSKIREHTPHDWRVHLGLGQLRFKKQQFREGLGHYQELARLAPKEAGPGFLDRAEWLFQKGDKAAIVWFIHAADCFLKKGESERFNAVCQRVIELGLEPIEQLVTDRIVSQASD